LSSGSLAKAAVQMEHPEEVHGAAKTSGEFRPDLTQDEFDREFFAHILRHGDSNLDVMRRLAELLARSGDYSGALELDRCLAARCPLEPIVHYNLACSLSMNGQQSAAIDALARALELGYSDLAHLDTDPDLDALRELPSFQAMLRRRTSAD